MGHTTGTRKGLSVRVLAGALGVSKSQVGRDLQAGMPADSVDAARAWRSRVHDVSRTVEGRIDRPQLFGQHSLAQGVVPAPGASLRDHAPQMFPAAPAGEGSGHQQPSGGHALGQPPPDGGNEAPEPGDTAEYRRARAERERTRAEREALELEQLRGKLIDVEDAGRAAFTAFRGLRDALENIPARIKDQVAAESDAFRVEQLIAAEIASVLSSFDVSGAVRETDDEADDD